MLRTEVTEWNEPWSQRDRARIAAALEAIPGGVCVVPCAGNRVGVWIDDRLALITYPGYLEWPGGRWNKDLPRDLFPDMQGGERSEWHGLSTFQDRS
jgi:hypothetical protein